AGPLGLEVMGPETVLFVRKIEFKELPPTYKDDTQRIQGEWVPESWEEDGLKGPPEKFADLRFTFTGKRVRTNFFGEDEGDFWLDETKNPKCSTVTSAGHLF